MEYLNETTISNPSIASTSSGTSSESTSHIGEPSVFQSFYDALTILREIDSGSVSRRRVSQQDIPRTRESEWHRFLDSLAWLGDYAPGGRSVTSVGIEAEAQYNTCWVSTNGRLKPKVLHHLMDLVQCLKNVPSLSDAERKTLEDEIVSCSLDLSRRKVFNYRRRLFVHVRILSDNLEELVPISERHVLDDLRALGERQLNHSDFCALICDFSKTITMRLLDECCRNSRSQEWLSVRHYIGRLCSWRRAARVLIRGSVQFQHLIRNLMVKELPVMAPSSLSIRRNLSFETRIRRIIPDLDQGLLRRALEMRRRSINQATTEEACTESESSSSPLSIHAEISMAEFFHRSERTFAANDAYIGCSKPSCYCCDLYLKYHPYGFTARSCHGNIWTKWQVPITGSGQEGALEQHVLDNLRDMIQQIHRDIFSELLFNNRHERQLPDSATGLSCSITVSS